MYIEYKEAVDKDVPLLLKLDQTAFCRDFDCPFKTEEEVKKYFANSKVFLILQNEEPISYYSYKFKDRESVEINTIAIVPQYQKKGIGTTVTKKLLQDLNKIKRIALTVHLILKMLPR